MGFTVRFMIGTVVVLLCCWSIETTSLQIHQTNNESKPAEKLQKIEDERTTTPQSIVANLNEETSKTKTDLSTDNNKTLDNETSLSKLQKSETYKKATNQPETKTTRDEIARSIDIEKYVSKEFHNKNNVYTLPLSPDTQKYVEPDYNFHGSTPHDHEHTKDFHFDAELTTPKSLIFDHKFKEAVESVDQKLEHIDDSHELSSESESKENLNLEKLYDETKSNDTKANLNYINYKNIISNDTAGKNSLHKDLVVEAGTNLDFHSNYNETVLIDENDDGNNNTIVKKSAIDDKTETTTISNTIPAKGDLDKAESSTIKNTVLTTRKSNIVLTKPPSNKNASHISILSNNIETETVKAINRVQSTSEPPKGDQEEDARTPIDITKRGSVKFSDYAQVSTQPTVSNEIKKKKEQMFQENQIVPVHVEAPPRSTTERLQLTTETSESNETNYVITTTETVFATDVPEKLALFTTEQDTTTDNIETSTFMATEQTTTEIATEPTTYSNENISTTESSENVTVAVEKTPSSEPDNLTTTTESSSDNFSTTNFNSDVTTTETVYETKSPATNFKDNITITTENTIRTSKGIVFRETVPTTVPIPVTTSEIPTTSEKQETTTEEIATTLKITETKEEEKPSIPTTDANFVNLENYTNIVPELKHNIQNETETESTTENNTVSSDSYELSTMQPDDNSGTIAAITISSIGAVCLILLVGLLFIMKKRQKRFNYGQRCTPVSLDDYSMDNISVYNSVRRKGMMRSSKRSYGNPAFEDPASVSHPLNFPALGKFANNLEDIRAEYEEIPQITARTNELPEGCDTKNRYANVIPLPETRVFLTPVEGCPNSDYINANYVTGPKNVKGYYIACQAPMQNTVDDFWRMVWEQQSKVILMLTHLFENGVEKCVDYLPPSEVLDCHRAFGDFLVTLKKREVKDKYIISILQLKNMVSSSWREVTHFWYLGWPEKGVPSEANSLIAFLIEARSYMKSSSIDRKDVTNGNLNGTARNELNPVVVHCSPGTGRTGVVIACDIAIREFEQTRLVDVPRIVYKIRRDRASSVQTKEQYAFIYKVISLYATKLTGGALDSI